MRFLMFEMPSAAQVLSALHGGSVDGVLIGRYAKKREGYTLVYRTKGGISESELKDLTVNTKSGKR